MRKSRPVRQHVAKRNDLFRAFIESAVGGKIGEVDLDRNIQINQTILYGDAEPRTRGLITAST